MGERTGIGWCDHTFNPVWGCVKVSPGCKNCYAEKWSRRSHPNLWGPNSQRRTFGGRHWAEPLKWNRKALEAGQRRRVFCGSMCDIFEDHPDLEEPRRQLLGLIDQTPGLDWLLLTKRPENVLPLLEEATNSVLSGEQVLYHMANIWVGTSVETQEFADKRIPILRNIPATIRFLSCEPLLGPVQLEVMDLVGPGTIDWVIAGGESGPGARPMKATWARDLRRVCEGTGTAFFFKQWGKWIAPNQAAPEPFDLTGVETQVMPGAQNPHYAVGKKRAGNLLDGRRSEEFPEIPTEPIYRRLEIAPGTWAHVAPGATEETLQALKDLADHVRTHITKG